MKTSFNTAERLWCHKGKSLYPVLHYKKKKRKRSKSAVCYSAKANDVVNNWSLGAKMK